MRLSLGAECSGGGSTAMEPVFFLKALETVISAPAKVAGEVAWHQLSRNDRVVTFLSEAHIGRPAEDFESLYTYSLVSFAAKGKPVALLGLFMDQLVIEAFRVTWSKGTPSAFSPAF